MKTENEGFASRVYAYLKRIPQGKVVTYGQIACALGRPRASRAVGFVLHHNPDPDRIPCFKVVNRDGYLTGAFAFGGIEAQKARLVADGVEVIADRVDLEKYRWEEE